MGSTWLYRYAALAVISGALMACGDGDGMTGPSGSGSGVGSGSAPGPSGATITISASGVSPSQVSITTGQSVTIVNSDTRAHEIASDPHPAHTQCPAINALGVVNAGQTRLTNSFTGTGTCTFHDHQNPDTASLRGTITIR